MHLLLEMIIQITLETAAAFAFETLCERGLSKLWPSGLLKLPNLDVNEPGS